MIEKKVTASSLAAAISGVVVFLLNRYVFHGTISPGYVAEIDIAVPAVITFIAGWLAPHTPRPAPAAKTPPGPAS